MLLFLAGDVMLGRGIDQILPHHCDPVLFEGFVKSATRYVELAERIHGAIPRNVPFDYVWGEGLNELHRRRPDVRFINLETAATTSDLAEPKGINYRMHPQNVPVLTTAKIDICSLANNHVLDWGRGGLLETLDTLEEAGISYVGAGRTLAEAARLVIQKLEGRSRVIALGFGSRTSGIPRSWRADTATAGVNLLDDPEQIVTWIRSTVDPIREEDDILVVSVHFGGNWGYGIPNSHRNLAHALIEEAGAHVIHGHSSHHPKAIEIYRDRPILYGCGDLINDYEGIGGHEAYRSELVLMYFMEIGGTNKVLQSLEMVPFETYRFQLRRANRNQAAWLAKRMDRECSAFGGKVDLTEGGALRLSWH